MNSLSWLIYLAEVVDAFRVTFMVLTAVSVLGSVALVVVAGDQLFEERAKTARKWWIRNIMAGFVLMTAAIILPSSRTFYMIAASEIGERAIASPEAKEMLGEIRATLMRQLKTLRDDK